MKKINIPILGLILLFIIACEKEEETPLPSANASKFAMNNKASGEGGDEKPKRRLFWDEPMLPTGCVPREVDCFPFDIVVTPSKSAPINDLFRAIDGGVQGTIQAEFQLQQEFIVDIMATAMEQQEATQIIEEVIDGTLTASARYDDEDNQKFILFHHQGVSDPYFVLPFNE